MARNTMTERLQIHHTLRPPLLLLELAVLPLSAAQRLLADPETPAEAPSGFPGLMLYQYADDPLLRESALPRNILLGA